MKVREEYAPQARKRGKPRTWVLGDGATGRLLAHLVKAILQERHSSECKGHR